VAREGIAVVVRERNRFVDHLSLDQVKAVWRRATPASTWAEVDPSFPAEPLEPMGWKPDTPPATMLAEALFGPIDPLTRDDYEVTDDSKQLTNTVASSPNAIGYLPLTELKPGSGVRPIRVLSRPLYLEVSANSLREPVARRFVLEFLSDPAAFRASDGAVPVESSHRVYRKFTRP
jgi:ABC-type phosphate transport system substrate-binding protein